MHIIPEMPVPPIIDGDIVSKKTGDVITMTAYLKEVYQDMKTSTLKMLSDMKAKIERDTGISIEIKAVIGYPTDKIIEYVGDHRIDLIVMGTTKASERNLKN